MFERIYTTFAYANVIVQGMSFALHKLETFREAEEATAQEKFLAARSIDTEIGEVSGMTPSTMHSSYCEVAFLR